ncbi:FAD-binding protein [Jiangella sp. DSM 45060]|uniref:FAD-binding protein n=1 Tax=Jiangella sp. DSM 45060 TaxID=1798224 RepID=UPI00087ABE2F|nr:FAD-binding protein [Jiangella sp. DSM 45060]SDS49297.1 xylitol oxidase [Jiangella sp. DSM 45060]
MIDLTTTGPGRNWAGNVGYRAARILTPSDTAEVAEVVASAPPGSVKALGTRHSFNLMADTSGTLISTAGLGGAADLELDETAGTATVAAGVRYGDLSRELARRGWSLPNLASLPHISVAGAVATGTHGSGDRNRTLAATVTAIELVDGTGIVTTLRRGNPDFDGVVVSIGALGVVTRVTLEVEPAYEVAQTVYERLPFDAVLADFDAVTSLGYSTSLFTTWHDPGVVDQFWLKRRVDRDPEAPADVLGARPATTKRHPITAALAEPCTDQHDVPGAPGDRLPHFRLEFTPSSGAELQSEYLVARPRATAALAELRAMAHRLAPLVQVSEIRTMAADDLWLSPAYGTDAVGIHFTWVPDQPAVDALLPEIEDRLGGLAPRPHWGKRFAMGAATLAERFPRHGDFRRLADRFDPGRRFRNDYLDAVLG